MNLNLKKGQHPLIFIKDYGLVNCQFQPVQQLQAYNLELTASNLDSHFGPHNLNNSECDTNKL